IRTGRVPENRTRRNHERRAFAWIRRRNGRMLFPEQQQVRLRAVGGNGGGACRQLLWRLRRRLDLADLLLCELLEIGPSEIARDLKGRGKDRAAIVRTALDDLALPARVEQVGKTARRFLRLDQIRVVADRAQQRESS